MSGHRRRAVVAAVVMVSAACGGLPARAAAAGTSDEGLWYVTATGVREAHERTRGAGITVAVLDSPVNPTAPDLVGTDLVTTPETFCTDSAGEPVPSASTERAAEHATSIVGVILGTGAGADGEPGALGVAPEATVHHYTVFAGGDCRDTPTSGFADVIDRAVADGADIINLSVNGPDPTAIDAIARAQRAGVVVVAGVGNDGTLGWPAAANGVVAVEELAPDGTLDDQSVPGELFAVAAPGSAFRSVQWSGGAWDTYTLTYGTSNAAAWTSAVIALVWSAYPEATANQMIQSLLRAAGGGTGDLVRDPVLGYGVVSVVDMLATDPTTLPDVNPLLVDDPTRRPAYGDVVAGSPVPSPTPTPSLTPTAAPTQPPAAVPDRQAPPGPEGAGPAAAGEPEVGETGTSAALRPAGLALAALLMTAGLLLVVVRARRGRAGATRAAHRDS